MARCDVELIQGPNGETKRVLVNGVPTPGLVRVQTTGGPRDRSTCLITLAATSVATREEAPSAD